jgi:hypothetical protein
MYASGNNRPPNHKPFFSKINYYFFTIISIFNKLSKLFNSFFEIKHPFVDCDFHRNVFFPLAWNNVVM